MQSVFVIGGGPAGYACAVRAARLGLKVTLAERGPVGGTCVNWGCTPSKAMLYSAKLYRYALTAAEYGITMQASVDFSTVVSRRDGVVSAARAEMESVMEAAGVEIVRGEARVVAPQTVEVHRDGKVVDMFTTDHIVFATGSKPRPPTFEAAEGTYWNSNELVAIRELPQELVIVGGGIIGVEFASLFANLGSKVTVIEYEDRLMSWLSPQVSAYLQRSLSDDGVKVLTGRMVDSYKEGKVSVRGRHDESVETIVAPKCLIALGRLPVFDEASCAAVGAEYDEKGIKTNAVLRTTAEGVWAIGGTPPANRHWRTSESIKGIRCAENIAALAEGKVATEMDYSLVPSVIYSLPEVACAGVIPKGEDVGCITVPFNKNLRGIIEGHTCGFAQAWFASGTLKAVQVVGDGASETIHAFLAIMRGERTPQEVATTIYPHPTYGEVCQEVCAQYLGVSVY